MSSKPRLIVSNVIYQVRADAARKEKIFQSEKMKDFFLEKLTQILEAYSYKCYAFSIEDDHYHLALRTSSSKSISYVLQKVNAGFAKYYNRKKRTHGAVLSRPFTSIIVEENGLKDLVRYIHLNPLRCGSATIENLINYEWCGHKKLAQNKDVSLKPDTSTPNLIQTFESPEQYVEFVHESINDYANEKIVHQIRAANSGKSKFRKPEYQVFGNNEFLKLMIEKDRCGRLKVPRNVLEKVTLEKLHESIHNLLNLEKDDIFRRGRKEVKSTARELFAYAAKCRFDFSGVQIAAYLGVSDSAVSKMISRYEKIDRKDYLVTIITEMVLESNCVAA